MKRHDINTATRLISQRNLIESGIREISRDDASVYVKIGTQYFIVDGTDELIDDIRNWMQGKLLENESELMEIGVTME